MSYKFSNDHFSNNIELWKRELSKYASRPVMFLVVGTYEGRSALWALDNILTHPKSRLFAVDKYENIQEYYTFKQNLMVNPVNKKKVTILKGKSQDMLKTPQILKHKDSFDIIFIDAEHHAKHVLENAILCFRLLKPGGLMIFDDYTNSRRHDTTCPKRAIDSFLDAFADDLKVLYARWQVIIQKRVHQLPSRPCRSEFYMP